MIRKNSILAKLLALLLVLGLIVGCFAGCGNDSSGRDDDDDETTASKKDDDETTKPSDEPTDEPTKPSHEPVTPSEEPSDAPSTAPTGEPTTTEPSSEPTTEPSSEPTTAPSTEPTTEPTAPPEKLEQHQWNGITFCLGEDFEEARSDVSLAAYYSDDMDIIAAVYKLSDFGELIANSRKFANAFCQYFYTDYTISKAGPVYYAVAQVDTGLEITGFYVEGDYGWILSAGLPDDDELEEKAIGYVTSGSVEPGSIPELPVEPTEITIWAPPEDLQENSWLYQALDHFAMSHPEYNITFEFGICSEGEAGGRISADPEDAGDIYFFANDQIGQLSSVGALLPLTGSYADYVRKNNSQTLINTVTHADGNLYGFPVTNNTWFMYYNKDIFTEDDVKSLDAMLSKGKVSFPMSTAWYGGAFFFGNGCTAFGPQGNDAAAGFQLGGEKGYAAAKKMVEIAQHPNFEDDQSARGATGFKDGTIGAMFTGSWDYRQLREVLGDRLGVAPPPMVEIDGKQVPMRAFAGSKAIGVNPHAENPELAMELAAFLASAESQLARYEDRGVIPCHPALLENPVIQNDPVAMAEILTMANCSVVQPTIPEMGQYWDAMGNFGSNVISGDVGLENYKDMVDQLTHRLNDSGWW